VFVRLVKLLLLIYAGGMVACDGKGKNLEKDECKQSGGSFQFSINWKRLARCRSAGIDVHPLNRM
jgi:hypothetical protein